MGEHGLSETQRRILRAVQAAAPLAGARDAAAAVEGIVVPSARGMTPAERVEVYREQYWIRHLASLADDYPTLAWSLGGSDAFDALARRYLEAHPPATWDLQRLGHAMPAFVASQGHVPLACEAARLDWAFMEIFDAPDAPPFDPRTLAGVPEDAWPGARIELLPALRLVAVGHALHDVRTAIKNGEKVAREVPPAEARVAVWRDDACCLRVLALDAAAFDLLGALAVGSPLGQACEDAARSAGLGQDEMGQRLGGWFQEWTERGWVRRVRFA